MSDLSESQHGEQEPSAKPVSTGKIASGRWALALVVAAVAAWVVVNFAPTFDLPEELRGVDMYSPAELQERAATKSVQLYWQNTLIVMTLLGLCFGSVGLVLTVGTRQPGRVLTMVVGMLSGLGCGLIAAVVGIGTRRFLDTDVPLPLVDAANRLLVADIIVYTLTSVLLAVPIAVVFLASRKHFEPQKAVVVLLAGAVTGLLLPPLAAIAMPASQTNLFPPTGLGLTAIWLALFAILVFTLTMFTGSRAIDRRKKLQKAKK